ncbi:MAG: type II secretion system protein [Parcubacteria group bacterium]|nr:type II secretion system protein [Parcubacteria group bacterium]
MPKIKNYNKENGLTMIELIVAIGVFGLVVGMTVGIFVLSIISQRRIIALRNAEDNIRFAVEAMAREMKTGKNFSGGGSSVSFTNAKGEATVYRLNSNIIEKSSDGGVSYSAVSGAEVIVDYLNFYLMGQAISDGLEPRVTIAIGVTSIVGSQTANLKIQTTISERLLQN